MSTAAPELQRMVISSIMPHRLNIVLREASVADGGTWCHIALSTNAKDERARHTHVSDIYKRRHMPLPFKPEFFKAACFSDRYFLLVFCRRSNAFGCLVWADGHLCDF